MKKSLLAVILLIGIIILGSCQNLDNSQSAPGAGQVDERLIGAWKIPESDMTIIFDENTCTIIQERSTVNKKNTYTYSARNNLIQLRPIDGGKATEFMYRFTNGTLYLNGKKCNKISN